jgi:hypothetical protein
VNDHGRTELVYWVGTGVASRGVNRPFDVPCPAGDSFWASNLIRIQSNLLTGHAVGVDRHENGRQAGNALSSYEIRMLDAVSASCAERAA